MILKNPPKQKKPLKSYFPTYMSGSIFSQMPQAPWVEDSAQLEMDIAYFASWSGYKPATKFVEELSTNGIADSQKIADILWKLHGKSWTRLWQSYNLDYNPTDNYNIIETINRTGSSDRTIGRTEDTTGSVNTTTGGTEITKTSEEAAGTNKNKVDYTSDETSGNTSTVTTSETVTGTNKSKTDTTEDETTTVQYGKVVKTDGETDVFTHAFNSADKVPTSVTTDTEISTQSGSDTTTRNLVGLVTIDGNTSTTTNGTVETTANGKKAVVDATTTDGSTSSTTTGSVDTTTTGTSASLTGEKVKEDTTDNETEQEDTTRNREGNIGQTSYQDLIRQELELRKWNFFRQVFADCDRFLVLSIYDPCLLQYSQQN